MKTEQKKLDYSQRRRWREKTRSTIPKNDEYIFAVIVAEIKETNVFNLRIFCSVVLRDDHVIVFDYD